MAINRLRSLSGISIEIAYEIDHEVDADVGEFWWARNLSVSFVCPSNSGVTRMNGVIICRETYRPRLCGGYLVEFSAPFVKRSDDGWDHFWVALGNSVHTASSIQGHISINRPQFAFVAGNSWQIDPIQYPDWRCHNFNFAWLDSPQQG